MADDKLQAALLDWESEGGSAGSWAPEYAGASSPQADDGLDARHRRGSIGPPPVAAPLGEAASGAAHLAHLTHLLHARGEAVAPPSMTPAGSSADLADLHEDLERQPDGVPHLVIGLTALVSVVFAAVLISVLLSGPTVGSIAVAALALLAVPFIVSRLGAKAERDRDHVHPSR